MTRKNAERVPAGPTYRSGAVAKLTGIPVQTLRVWERRYTIVGPEQTASGQRQYSPEDVSRLKVIKQLVDAGHAIGSVAKLDLGTLKSMLQQAERAALVAPAAGTTAASAPPRAAIVGEALALRIERAGAPWIRVVATCPDLASAPEAFEGVTAGLLLVELPTLRVDPAAAVRALAAQLGAGRVVVEYGFGTQALERELLAQGYGLLRAPAELAQLEALCRAPGAAPRPRGTVAFPELGAASPPRFDKKTLAEIATASVALNCECPHHISKLLVQLGDFETYSGECESRDPEDAALHRYLKEASGRARALMEEAMARVVEAEGIALEAEAST